MLILKKRKKILTILLVLIINICANLVLAEAAIVDLDNSSKEDTVAVGWYYHNSKDLNYVSSTNAYSGFVNEYLGKISATTGLNFKYEYFNLADSLKLLEEGKLDLVPGVLYTSERASKFNYIRPPMSVCNVSIFAKTDSKKEKFDNSGSTKLSLLKGKTIGIIRSLKEYSRKTLKEEKFDISNTKFKYYLNFKALKDALINGEVDYIIELTPVINMKNIKEILKLKQTHLYLVTNMDNEKINNKINLGLRNIDKENKYFSDQLFYKYISTKRQIEFLTAKERKALEKIDKLTFYVRKDKDVLYNSNQNTLIGGYYSNYLKKISKILDKDYQVIQVNKEELSKSDIPGFFLAVNLNKGKLVKNKDTIYSNYVTNLISNPTRYSEKLICVRKGVNKLDSNAIYASANDIVVDRYRTLGNRAILTKNPVEALKLLEDKKVDAAIVDIFMTKYVNSSSNYSNIEILGFDEPVVQVMIGIKGVDPNLFSAVNRAITLLPERETRAYTFAGKSGFLYKPTLREMAMDYSQVFILLGIILLIGVILFIKVLINKNTEINKLAKKADEANRIKVDFLSRMSHEMRTPLNAIISYAKFGLTEKASLEDQEYFEKIKYSSETLLDLMKDSLELENIKVGMKDENKTIEALNIIKKIESIIQPQAEKKNIEFKSIIEVPQNFKNNIIYVNVKETALQQILLNLLTNAVKYTKPKGVVIWKKKITLINKKQLFIEHEIKDNGVGMSEEFQKHMFEEFSMEENELSKTEIGTGLGLALCKKMVDEIGGKLVCESKLGVGTTFKLKVMQTLASAKDIENYKNKKASLLKKSDESSNDNSSIRNEFLANTSKKSLKILICEDILINEKIVEKILIKNGMQVEWAQNGKIGVEMAEKNNYDLIIMDIRMPVMDGLTAAKIIRSKDSKIPIVALSANVYASDVKKSLEAGMNAHLGKPIDNKELIDTIYRLTNLS